MEKERSGILQRFADVKAESKLQQEALERSTQNVPELKMLLERSERQRGNISQQLTFEVPIPFQKSRFFVCVNSNYLMQFLTIDLI